MRQKLEWAFNLYDLNKDGHISKEVTGGLGRWERADGGQGSLDPSAAPRRCWRS